MNRIKQIQQALHRADGNCPGIDDSCEKHQKMAANPFRFFRGSANLFYDDIANHRLSIPDDLNHLVPLTMVQGDCHLSNFGFFTEEGSHGDQVIFSLNDFDDACVGNMSWDLVRFITSLLLSQEYCEGIINGRYHSDEIDDIKDLSCANIEDTINSIRCFLESYIQQCQQILNNEKSRSNVITKLAPDHPQHKFYKKAKRRSASGKHFASKSALAKAIDQSSMMPVFKENPDKFAYIDDDLYREINEVFAPYVDDSILDIVRRIGAGTGSVNMDRFYLLIGPQDYMGDIDLALCHIVEIKEQRLAAPLGHFENASPTNRLNPAHLTVVCQCKMQRKPDLILDEVEWRNSHWLVRSRHHAKVGIAPEDIFLTSKNTEKSLLNYVQMCGQSLALAHGRSDRRSVRFEESICENLPDFIDEFLETSLKYAVQVREDHQSLRELLKIND